MHLSSRTVFALCLATFVGANPFPRPVPETVENTARGLVYTPRAAKQGNGNNNNNGGNGVVTITQTQETQLTEISRGREIQLTKLVEQRLVIIDKTNIARDNVRKNHFKNANSQQNTIVIVVTQIVDSRDSSNKNIRYMTHQIVADNQAENSQFVMVQQAQQMTINGTLPTGTASQASPEATGISSNADSIAVYDPTAAPSASNKTQILPEGAAAPSFDGVQQIQDPAMIIEENQQAFVSFNPFSG